MNDATIQAAMEYAALGWKVVPLYGVDGNGKCSCRKPECDAAGKHPCCGENWLAFASSQTEDDVAQWSDRFKGERNIGIVLGPAGGIIDIECDSPEADALLRRVLGDDYDSLQTPTYGSSRGHHRLFKWNSSLPDRQKLEVGGLEIRIGGGGKSTQSVAPPSRHHTGAQYRWLPGLSPSEVPVAEIPPALMNLIETLASKKSSKPARAIFDKPAVRGSRHNDMLRIACRQAMRMTAPTPQEQNDCALIIAAINAKFCVPPLEADELEQITRAAIEFRLRQTGADVAAANELLAEEPDVEAEVPSGEGGMRLTIVKSDPVEYVLHCPAWKKWNGTGDVNLTHKELYDAENLSAIIGQQIPQVCLETYPGSFSDIWAGRPAGKRGPAVEGLLSVLIRDAVAAGRVVQGSAIGHQAQEYLRLVVEALETAAPCGSEGTPDADGDPTRMADGSVWLVWNEVLREIIASRRLGDGAARSIRKVVESVIGTMTVAQHQYRKVRRLYTKFTPDEMGRLRTAAYAGVVEGPEIVPVALEAPAREPEETPHEVAPGLFDDANDFRDPFASDGF